MRRYTFKLVINEGSDEFWDDIRNRQLTGCEEVKELIDEALFAVGLDIDNCSITLEKYENADL